MFAGMDIRRLAKINSELKGFYYYYYFLDDLQSGKWLHLLSIILSLTFRQASSASDQEVHDREHEAGIRGRRSCRHRRRKHRNDQVTLFVPDPT